MPDGSGQTENAAAFTALAALARAESGLTLVPEKRLMVQSRLRHRLRALAIDSFDAYVAYVTSDAGTAERRHMVSALTTNVSHFFREPHHFALLSTRLLPLLRLKAQAGRKIRIWSAGCSTGQEPYSIAMHLLSEAPWIADADFRILATDIDPKVLDQARTGMFTANQVRPIPDACRVFLGAGSTNDRVMIGQEIRDLVRFLELNLLSDWPMRGPFDAIFCRNVVIYFDGATRAHLWPRFVRFLAPDGLLFLGHSERVSTPEQYGLACVGPTSYAHAPGARATSKPL